MMDSKVSGADFDQTLLSNMEARYFASLGQAPQTALIRVVIEYHSALVQVGRSREAICIAGHLDELLAQQELGPMDLSGMDLLLKDGLHSFLLRINSHLPALPTQVVEFKNVSLRQSCSVQRGSWQSTTHLFTAWKQLVTCRLRRAPAQVQILKDVSGYLLPSTLTLFLGPAGSAGPSSMLKMLGGRLNMAGRSGEVTYNGKPVPHAAVHRLAAIVDDEDAHLPTLTVLETLQIAKRLTHFWPDSQQAASSVELQELLREAVEAQQDPVVSVVMAALGLTPAMHVAAGRLSAEQAHRLSCAEMLCGGFSVFLLHSLNGAGTDDAVTYEVVRAVQACARVRGITVAATLVQPPAQVFDLFDRVVLFGGGGQVLFQGARADALPYFASLGYVKPAEMEVAEFLCNVVAAGAGGAQGQGLGHDALVHAYQESPAALVPEDVKKGAAAAAAAAVRGEGGQEGGSSSVWRECKELTWRNLVCASRDRFLLLSRALQVSVLALFLGTLVLRASHRAEQMDIQLRRAIFFTTIVTLTVVNLGLMPGVVAGERRVMYKQLRAAFFRPASFCIALFFGELPFSLAAATVWTLITYFLCGLSLRDGGWHFWIFYLATIYLSLLGSSAVRAAAFLLPTFDVASLVFGVWLSLMTMFAGNSVARASIPRYWRWFYYLDPMQWVLTMMQVSEMGSASYARRCSTVGADAPDQTAWQALHFPFCIGRSGPGLKPAGPDNTIGHAWQAVSGFYSDMGWMVVAVAVLTTWLLLFQLLTYAAVAHLRHTPAHVREEAAALPLPHATPLVGDAASPAAARTTTDLENGGRGAALEEEEEEEEEEAGAMRLSWQHVECPTVHRVSGWAEGGDMLALLGGPQSGVHELLTLLASGQRGEGGKVLLKAHGHVHNPAVEAYRRCVAFAQRVDAHMPFSTVRESVQFSANLRLGRHLSTQQKRAAADEALDHMQLQPLADRQVWTLGGGIAAEASRRLAIAVEMAARPCVLLVREPTTGLDFAPAALAIACLQSYARAGGGRGRRQWRAVVCSMEAGARLTLLSMFSRALLLARGRTVYFGPIGVAASHIQAYFESIPASPRFSTAGTINPVAYALDLVGEGVTERAVRNRDYAFEYRVSELCLANTKRQQQCLEAMKKASEEPLHHGGSERGGGGYGASLAEQVMQVAGRMQRQYWRNMHYSCGRLLYTLVVALLFGSLFWQQDISSSAGTSSRAGQIYEYTTLLGIFNGAGVVSQISAALPAFKRERSSGTYHIFLFNIAWLLAEIPYLALMVLVFCVVANGMSGVATQSVSAFFLFYFILLEDVLTITLLGMSIAVACPSTALAAVVVPLIISFWIPTGGLVMVWTRMPAWWVWLYWANPQAYAYNALMSTAFFCDYSSIPSVSNASRSFLLHSR
eukprot:jgi/Mesen1/10459/ME000082S09965